MSLGPGALALQRRVQNPLLFRLWTVGKLPSAWFAGVRLESLDEARCVCSVPYGWRSQNPFRSTYFAAQAMAAEMSTGALVLLATADFPASTLILDMQATFLKKATARARFTCEGGAAVFEAVAASRAAGEPRTIRLETIGKMDDGVEVSRFAFTWSVKARTAG